MKKMSVMILPSLGCALLAFAVWRIHAGAVVPQSADRKASSVRAGTQVSKNRIARIKPGAPDLPDSSGKTDDASAVALQSFENQRMESQRAVSGDVSPSSEEAQPTTRNEITREAARIRDRLHMAVSLEASDDPGMEKYLESLYQSGWIINASVEDVEAARAKAAKTPQLEDDFQAEELAHRASCRFFYQKTP